LKGEMREKVKRVRIRRIRSLIDVKESHKRTARALGLTRIGRERVLNLTPQIEGMLRKIQYLIEVEEV